MGLYKKSRLNMIVHVQVCEHSDASLRSMSSSKTDDYDDAIAPGKGDGISRFGMSNKSQTPSESSRLK